MKKYIPTLIGLIVLLLSVVAGTLFINYPLVHSRDTQPILKDMYCVRNIEMEDLHPKFDIDYGLEDVCDRYIYATNSAEFNMRKDNLYGTNKD